MKFKGIAVSVLALTPVLFGRPSSGETLDHGDDKAPRTMPRPACPGVPADAVFIPSVVQVWAIQEADQVRLVFSNQLIGCAAARGGAAAQGTFTSELADLSQANCSDGWVSEFGVPNPMPGVVELAQVGINPAEGSTRVEQSQGYGCSASSACVVRGVGSGGVAPGGPVPHGPDATLEIYSITDECFIGRLSNYVSLQEFPPPPDMNGVFVAEWCPAE